MPTSHSKGVFKESETLLNGARAGVEKLISAETDHVRSKSRGRSRLPSTEKASSSPT
jgi:hypothetical protein